MTIIVTIPNVQLTLEQLIVVIQGLEPDARSKIAQALLADVMDDRFAQLLVRLAGRSSLEAITDQEVKEEIRVVRKQVEH